MSDLWHPDVEDILTAHEHADFVSKVRTPGFHLSSDKGIENISDVIEEAKEHEEVYTAAAVYLKKLLEKHPFSDGNHRTAYIVTLQFLRRNDAVFVPEETQGTETIVNVLKKKVKFSSIEELSNWLQTGESL